MAKTTSQHPEETTPEDMASAETEAAETKPAETEPEATASEEVTAGQAGTETGEEPPRETPAEEGPDPEEQPEEQIERLQAALETAKEDRLRAIADSENARRRAQREIENSRKYACEPLARNLLGVIDNLNRALGAVPAEKADGDGDLKNLRVGVEMTAKEFEAAFAKAGIEKISPMDERFDPNLHQAMFEIPDPDCEPGTVKNVVAHGYKLHDRLLRPAMVGVSKKA